MPKYDAKHEAWRRLAMSRCDDVARTWRDGPYVIHDEDCIHSHIPIDDDHGIAAALP